MRKNMKKIGILIISIVSAMMVVSCATKRNGPYLSATPGNPSITSPADGKTYTLNKSNATDTLFTMNWTAPDYGYPAAVTYTVQMDNPGDNFANPVKLGTANLPSFSITEGDLNSTLLGSGLKPNQAATVEVRVTASISDSLKEEISKPISMVFTPYSNYTYIYVPGNYQVYSGYGSAWTPQDAPPLAMTGVNVFDGYVYINDTKDSDIEFKFTKDQNWNLAWGAGSSPGTISSTGGNITLPTDSSGYYKIHVNTDALTYSIEKTTWSIIGDATAGGWSTDTPMTYDKTKKVWTVTTNLTAGGLKFRANDSWDLNYGDTGADGTLDAGGDNINVPSAGNYTVTLDFSNPPLYTYSLKKN